MVARVALVGGQVQGPVHGDGQVQVHLDHRGSAALVPVVGGPGLVPHILHAEVVRGGQGRVAARALAGLGDGGLEDGVHPVRREDDPRPGRLVAVLHGARALQHLIQPGQGVLEGGLRRAGRPDLVQGLGLVVEAEALAVQARQVRRHGPQLPQEVVAPGRLAGRDFSRGHAVQDAPGLAPQLGQGPRGSGLCLGLPGWGPVIGIHELGVMAAHRQHQPHIVRRPP